jgi:acetoacetyl-CoA synthase
MSERPLWQPDEQRIRASRLFAFMNSVGPRVGERWDDYDALWAWSIAHREQFWAELWDFCDVIGDRGTGVLVDDPAEGCAPGARWFPDARLNYARNLLRRRDEADALVFWGEDCVQQRLSHAELWHQVAVTVAALRAEGVGPGDRVAAYLPNMPATVIAMLASAAIGAVFSSASPDFGVQGVFDRFGQIEPKVLFACDGYFYNGRAFDCLPKVADVSAALPTVVKTVVVPYFSAGDSALDVPKGVWLEQFTAGHGDQTEIAFQAVAFDHPLFVLYSSGTTGVPKAIVHGTGGTLLQHLKEHRLHGDVQPNDRLFYFTTCGWMMWNWLVSGLASGATLLLYDGSPMLHRGRTLFDFAEAEAATHFGTSAKFIDALAKSGMRPADSHRLDRLRAIFSTGSVLLPAGFDYVYEAIKADVQLSSISGGTDIISCFALGNPIGPVWRGELQCRGLGMAVDVFDDAGRPLREGKGELVCTRTFPSMPVGFWNDPDGEKYRAAYFERFPGVWCHGDFAELTAHSGMVIHGRSDATLNPGGVRIGTAEIYRQVEKLPEVLESLVIGQRWPLGSEGEERLLLFVRLREGLVLDDDLQDRIRRTIRANTTPRHLPARIYQVPDIPRTKSGKIVELAVRAVAHGEPVRNLEALANPEALDYLKGLTTLLTE